MKKISDGVCEIALRQMRNNQEAADKIAEVLLKKETMTAKDKQLPQMAKMESRQVYPVMDAGFLDPPGNWSNPVLGSGDHGQALSILWTADTADTPRSESVYDEHQTKQLEERPSESKDLAGDTALLDYSSALERKRVPEKRMTK
ncbi:hypothetical protein NL676_021467 [Syzygium grande]|nr:hypothetical protein NL676_021467 [Syzygium grande]